MRTRTRGIRADECGKVVDKQYRGRRIFARLGQVSQEEAERWVRAEQDRIDLELSQSTQRNFSDAAAAYLNECERRNVRTLETIAYHITLLLPYVGMIELQLIHNGSFESFIDKRLHEDMVSSTTVNRTLEVARTILNRAARVWRDNAGSPWLTSPPLIEMLDECRRQPYPISREEQRRLFAELPPHLECMALFAVNTGLRDENICGLRWEWERKIPELGTSVFVIPAEEYKGKRPHVVILNDAAKRIVEVRRGEHEVYVFTYADEIRKRKSGRIDTINNSAWQKARQRAGLEQVRVHDLRHTYGQRLRDAGVSEEDRAALLGHATESMPEHYATPTIQRLMEMANKVQLTRDTPTLLRIANWESHAKSHAPKEQRASA